jgi:hypothetical protein
VLPDLLFSRGLDDEDAVSAEAGAQLVQVDALGDGVDLESML